MLSHKEKENAVGLLSFITGQGIDYAVYGTGEVGRELLSLVKKHRFRLPSLFIDDAEETTLDGVEVVHPSKLSSHNVALVILGTNNRQQQMAGNLKQHKFSAGMIDLSISMPFCEKKEAPPRESFNGDMDEDDYLYGWRQGPAYQTFQKNLLNQIKKKIVDGCHIEEALTGFNGTMCSERVVEYSFVINWLNMWATEADLLDIGCVLNNEIVASEMRQLCKSVWFCNPAQEPNRLGFDVRYEVNPINQAGFDESSFDLITCLSTIEHIGFDNSQYGDTSPPRYAVPTMEPMEEALNCILKWLKPGGRFLISVPYGVRCAGTHRVTKKLAFQIFDHVAMENIKRFVESKGYELNVIIFEGTLNGWRRIKNPVSSSQLYAHGFPAAQAVAMLNGVK